MLNGKNAVSFRLLLAPALTLLCFQAIAADIAREVTEPSDNFEGFLEIGLGLGISKLPLIGFNDKDTIEESTDSINYVDILIDGRFRYKNAFLELFDDSFNNVTIGYKLTGPARGNIELVGTSLFFDVVRSRVPGLETITHRSGDFNLGVRSSIFNGNTIVQFELISNVTTSHNGVIGSMQVGREKQIRNWNLHGLAGVRYFSDSVVDHYIGVSSEEATATVPEYKGDAGLMPSLQVGATLPLNEKWIFKAQAEYTLIPDSFADSPLAQGNVAYGLRTSIGYVFGNR